MVSIHSRAWAMSSATGERFSGTVHSAASSSSSCRRLSNRSCLTSRPATASTSNAIKDAGWVCARRRPGQLRCRAGAVGSRSEVGHRPKRLLRRRPRTRPVSQPRAAAASFGNDLVRVRTLSRPQRSLFTIGRDDGSESIPLRLPPSGARHSRLPGQVAHSASQRNSWGRSSPRVGSSLNATRRAGVSRRRTTRAAGTHQGSAPQSGACRLRRYRRRPRSCVSRSNGWCRFAHVPPSPPSLFFMNSCWVQPQPVWAPPGTKRRRPGALVQPPRAT